MAKTSLKYVLLFIYQHKKTFAPWLILLIIFNMLSCYLLTFSLEKMGIVQVASFILFVLIFILNVLAIFLAEDIVSTRQQGLGVLLKKAFIFTPSYVLHQIFYLLRIMVGLILFIVPGVWILGSEILAPTLCLFSQDDTRFFKKSRQLTQGKLASFITYGVLIKVIALASMWTFVLLDKELSLMIDLLSTLPLTLLGLIFDFWLLFQYLCLKSSK